MKRFLDIMVAVIGLCIAAPVLLVVLLLVWRHDGKSPFYIAPRVGRGGRVFRMMKVRSMVANADTTGVDSTAANDRRITPVGRFVRRYKIDEITQLWNVVIGDMSLVGPRPNVQRDVELYTDVERRLLTLRPGITDFASIVFADEGEILKGSADPDLRYHQIIRPWKSRLGLLYVDRRSLGLDIQLMALTVVAVVSRARALAAVGRLLDGIGADPLVKAVAARANPLTAYPPPGASDVVAAR